MKMSNIKLDYDYDDLDQIVEECDECGTMSKDILCPLHEHMKEVLDEENTG